VTTKVLWSACQIAAERAGLDNRRIHPHTSRHGFATHLLVRFKGAIDQKVTDNRLSLAQQHQQRQHAAIVDFMNCAVMKHRSAPNRP
jgi:integrase